MFRIKICGITSVQDARLAAEAGADAIGVNFYPPSPRYVALDQAARIVEALPSGVAKVGVFVNMPAKDVLRHADRLQLDWIQLHGDEPPEMVGQLGGRQVLRAFRCRQHGEGPVWQYLDQCQQAGYPLPAILVDAYCPDAYGGTGEVLDWEQVGRWSSRLGATRLVLAGGLKPDNIAQAIAAARPWAVDTASGVESAAGKKDPQQVRAFVEHARAAFGL